jgi:uncharacterized membrane protein
MGYPLLILGVALWSGAHLFKRLAPDRRAVLGEGGKGLVSVLLLLSIVLMVLGYRWADPVWLWSPPPFLRHLNNLLVFLAFYLFAASGMKTAITRVVRHPQLTGVKTWAVAHLLVVPTLAGAILFGGLLAWAVVSVIVINRATPRPAPNPPAGLGKEIGAVVGAVVATAAVGWLHGWLGPWPFG